MDSDRYNQIELLFHAALEIAPVERAAYLASACGDDRELRAEVESMIAAHEEPGSFIDKPPAAAAAEVLCANDQMAEAGRIIGRYRIIRRLGEGGMGQVYLAEETELGRQVALKLLPAKFTSDENRVRRFIREARAASAINHPNIIAVYEIGCADGLHFIAAEFVEGRTLRELIKNSPLSVDRVIGIASQIAEALTVAHTQGIVHRDLKPENLIIRDDGLVKVLDFGLAKLTKAPSDGAPLSGMITAPGMILGTVRYMSPEQADGLPVDARADIFSLGVIIYEMMTGKTPFDGRTVHEIIAAIVTRDPEAPAEAPLPLQSIIKKTLQKDPAERYQSMEEMREELRVAGY